MPRLQVWMLTGDKLETATCTAKNAHLVTRNQDIHVFRLVKRFPLWGLVGVMLPFAPWPHGLERAPNEGREKQIDHLGGSRASVVSLGGINDPGEANGLLPGVIQGHLVVALGSRCPWPGGGGAVVP